MVHPVRRYRRNIFIFFRPAIYFENKMSKKKIEKSCLLRSIKENVGKEENKKSLKL